MLRGVLSQATLALAVGLPSVFGLLPSPPNALRNVPRSFDLTVSWNKHAPNGVDRNVILINGQFPGPEIEVNEGDDVVVTVHNKMPFNTTMHFHGIEQLNTPWSDGAPGVTQREIQPGASFRYKWTATQYGEYWYHAHHKGQIDDGQYGPLIIHPKDSRPKPFGLISQDRTTVRAMEKAAVNVQPLMLSDWRNIDSYEAWDIEIAASSELPCFDSLLINGKGRIDCWSSDKLASLTTPQMKALLGLGNFTSLTPKGCLPKSIAVIAVAGGFPSNVSAIPDELFNVCNPTNSPNTVIKIGQQQASCYANGGVWAAFDVVGAYSTLTASFSIDGLPMWVYAVDGEYIEPQLVNAISVANGDRYSFLVHLTAGGDYTIRQAGTLPIQLISGQATLSYEAKNTSSNQTAKQQYIDDAGHPLGPGVVFFNQSLQKPYPAFPVGQKADQTFLLTLGNAEGRGYIWAMNGTAAPAALDGDSDSTPVLFMPRPANTADNITITTLNNTWVDLIFVVSKFPQPAHPMHKHGNKMWLIGSGQGAFNYSSVDEAMRFIPHNFNLVDPPRRDGFATLDAPRGPTWVAVRYHVTNPGAWLLHCHISTHLRGGMSMVLQDAVADFPKIPDEYLHY
ncbi:multicopper oxidase [Xylariaceae sp. AK1471]|nr:multicopper oxidase [Xylariaceae sp. AK1471]